MFAQYGANNSFDSQTSCPMIHTSQLMSVEAYARKYGMNAYDGVRVHVSNGGRDGTHSRVTSTFEAGHIPAVQIYRVHQLRVASMEGYGITS